MAIGPVQLIVLGFSHPEFHGEIIDELERLRESDTVRVIDAHAVRSGRTAVALRCGLSGGSLRSALAGAEPGRA